MSVPSHAGDAATESLLSVARYRCRVMLATVLPSHAGDDDAKATWLRCDVDVKSC
jgi:hypothetical protein